MAGDHTSRTGAVCAALTQAAVGLAVHTAAAGCLPALRSLAVALPAAVAVLLVVQHALRDSLRSLAVGQLAVHGVLGLAGCVTAGAHAHAGTHDVLMVPAHVAALMLCRVVLDRVVALAERAAATARHLLTRWRHRPQSVFVPVPIPLPAASIPVRRKITMPLTVAPRRGPPGALLPA